MSIRELQLVLRQYEAKEARLSRHMRMQAARLLARTAQRCIDNLRNDLHEGGTEANRRNAKRRETEVDPKPPVKPVSVAEPSKPKKPKYSGNHAPSAPR